MPSSVGEPRTGPPPKTSRRRCSSRRLARSDASNGVARRDATAALRDPELAPLARIAADLRHYPSPEFKASLRAQLERRASMTAVTTAIRQGFTTVTPYIRVREAGLVDFLAQVFDARETFSGRGSGGGMHREVRVGDSMVIIGEGDVGGGVMPIR